jgi:hypothetical protein
MFGNAQASPWMNNYEMPTSPHMSQYAPPNALAPGMSGAFPMLGNTQAMPFPQPASAPAYTPSDLRPMTAAFPRQMLMGTNNGNSSAQNGDLQPLPMDAFSLSPQSNGAGVSHIDGQTPFPPAQPTPLLDTATPFMPSSLPEWMNTPIPSTPSLLPEWMNTPIPSISSPLLEGMNTPIPSTPSLLPEWMNAPIPSISSPLPVATVTSPTMQPPSLKEDPMLEEVMRQAQMGLFVLSGR